MDKVIGLGRLGCSVAEELTAYPEYRIYKIDVGIKERASLSFPEFENMQQYEEGIDAHEVSLYLRTIKDGDECLLVVEGGTAISGAVLRVVEAIRGAKVNVLYISPDRSVSTETQKRYDRIAFNVLQEYARSGAIENIILVNKPSIEILAGEASIKNYEKNISYFISYVLAMINYYNHTNPIVSTESKVADHRRIATLGVSSLEERAAINLLFPLKEISDVVFHYGIPEKDVSTDETLMKKIKEQVKSYRTTDEMSVSFAVYPTTLESPVVLCTAYSSTIQDFAPS
jgi:hypothetical protein